MTKIIAFVSVLVFSFQMAHANERRDKCVMALKSILQSERSLGAAQAAMKIQSAAGVDTNDQEKMSQLQEKDNDRISKMFIELCITK